MRIARVNEKEGLSRARLVAEARGRVQEEGVEGLWRRAGADRLHVKAASLYWHVRDRRELLELLAESILDGVPAPRAEGWRGAVRSIAKALEAAVASRQDARRILLEVPEAIKKRSSYERVKCRLQSAGR